MITKEEADVLLHTSSNGRYVTDEAKVIAMGASGLLFDHGPQALAGGMHYLVLTAKGREALSAWKAAQPQPPKLTKRQIRAKARYHRYLDYGDGFQNFCEFLKWDRAKEKEGAWA